MVGRSTPSLLSRGGTLLPSVYADARCIDAVIVSQATLSSGQHESKSQCQQHQHQHHHQRRQRTEMCTLRHRRGLFSASFRLRPYSRPYSRSERVWFCTTRRGKFRTLYSNKFLPKSLGTRICIPKAVVVTRSMAMNVGSIREKSPLSTF